MTALEEIRTALEGDMDTGLTAIDRLQFIIGGIPDFDPITVEDAEWIISALESLQRENDTLKAGIKRLSDEEELLAETTDGDMMSLVSLAAKLAEAEQLARTYEGEANQLRDVSISNRIRAEEAEAGEKKLREVLAFYANPEIYKPHPHGPAFDRRDLSYHAVLALASTGGEHHAE